MKKIKFGKRRGEKRLKDREPKIVENVKQAFFARANKTSEISSSFLTDIVNKQNKHKPFPFKRNARIFFYSTP